jgi:flagellar basal body-associated protein FliL
MKNTALSAMVAMASPPPPPPPKRSRKTLIAVILVILIVVLAVGVYLATRGNGTNPSVTPTPTPTPIAGVTPTPTSIAGATPTATPIAGATPTPTAKPTGNGGGSNVAGASSLQFTATVTNSSGQSQGTYTYYAKNAGTSNLMIRIEFTDPSGDNFVYIINGALHQAWVESGGQWTDISSAFSSQWSTWNTAFTGYKNSLVNWSGVGDYTYSSPNGDTVRITNINLNPSLADSLFQHS